MPTISVIIPAYNAEKFIKETINSVLNQTFRDFELIVINDGSTDGTLEVVSTFSDSRIQVFSYPNSGPQKSRNRGIDHAKGEYLSFLDADDLWTPDKLERQLQALHDNPDAAVAYSWTDFINGSGERLPGGQHFKFTNDVYERLLLGDFIGSGSNPLIRKDALLNVGPFDESLVGGQDWEMWLRLAAQYQFVVVPSTLVFYRQSGKSWSSNLKRQEQGYQQVIEKSLANAPEKIKKLRKKIMGNRYKFSTFDALRYSRNRQDTLLAARFLWVALKNQPIFLTNKMIWLVLLKIILGLIFSPEGVKTLQVSLRKIKFSTKNPA
ncbi:glycosyltransferase family 2 protein [Oscillatoria acuminata]|uniref:Glycosyl transferase n=1 Tax=Oscillatoria acuminata PCC 6304 TaxID=56110 RepID=K9TCB7_9CYAN|nr:glycosyltransferase [Oscillatoria acuminata]AFY80532.1 glycosyl transferase [Oscillatoria acuminata PCC 6304]